jgi:phage terminase large subunit-like protein
MAVNSSQSDERERYRADPCSFIEEVLVNPEDGKPFVLYPEQRVFLRKALVLTGEGRFPYPEMLYSAPKKSGKTATAAMIALYVAIVLAGNYGEIYCLANDFDQAQSRVFGACIKIVQASPKLRNSATITAKQIVFRSTNTFIQACASDYSGFAGGNPTLTIADEAWGFISESAKRLFDEAVPSPARRVSGRLTVTYAGFLSESDLLEALWKRGMSGKKIGRDLHATKDDMLCCWISKRTPAPWQDKRWKDQMRASLRPAQYLRLVENQWVETSSGFVDMELFDACVDAQHRPIVASPTLPVHIGVDASTKRDSTAIAVVTFENGKVRLVSHKIFTPSPKDPIDFEATVERALLEYRRSFRVREIRYDPYQLVSLAQRLTKQGLPMQEFPQTVGNLTEASSNLFELIKANNLIAYPDAAIRLAMSRAVAIESSRGWRIAKEKTSHRIDIVVALAQAALASVQEQRGEPGALTLLKLEMGAARVRSGMPVEVAAAANAVPIDQLRKFVADNSGAAAESAARPVRGTEEAWEFARKLCENAVSAESACEQAFNLHKVSIEPYALQAFVQRANAPTTGPSRPRNTPAGAKSLDETLV